MSHKSQTQRRQANDDPHISLEQVFLTCEQIRERVEEMIELAEAIRREPSDGNNGHSGTNGHAFFSEVPEKELYNTHEVAKLFGKGTYTVREWCRLARVHAEKAETGRGDQQEWRVSHDEVLRIRNEGLLPKPFRY